jgi:hypothetical protein
MGNASHSQIHTNLGALTVEVLTQAVLDLLGDISGYAQNVLSSPSGLTGLSGELRSGCLADGAAIIGGQRLALIDITTNLTNKLSHNTYLHINKL